MLESDILFTAIEELEQGTRGVKVEMLSIPASDTRWDAQIEIQAGASTSRYKVLIKKNVLPSSLPPWEEILQDEKTLLVSEYISNPAKKILENQGINYLDIAGNCYINSLEGIFLHVKGARALPKKGAIKHQKLNKNGIKLIFALLLNPELLNRPYREIAVVANISISTIGNILDGLEASKYIDKLNPKRMALVNKAELLSLWVTALNQTLKPKIVRGRFRLKTQIWTNLEMGDQSFWGGEPAADLLTNYLHPTNFTIFSNLDRKQLITELQLLPDDDKGTVTVCSIFWPLENQSYINSELKTVHPLLVYADLIGSGNDRNFETAKKIHAKYLQNLLD